jgi:hypothetical protein
MTMPDFTLDCGRVVRRRPLTPWRAVCNVGHLIYAVCALAVAAVLGADWN